MRFSFAIVALAATVVTAQLSSIVAKIPSCALTCLATSAAAAGKSLIFHQTIQGLPITFFSSSLILTLQLQDVVYQTTPANAERRGSQLLPAQLPVFYKDAQLNKPLVCNARPHS